jgi:hypothetical protein
MTNVVYGKKITGCPLYFRDLNADLRTAMLADWKRAGMLRLISIAKKGTMDIQIGEYYDFKDCEVV